MGKYLREKPNTARTGRKGEDDFSSNLVARSELMLAIAKAIHDKNWTQIQAAEFFGVGQPRVSDLIQGRVDRFTVDMLMIWLQKLGKDVSIQIRENVFASHEQVQLALYVCGTPEQRLIDNVSKLFGGAVDKFSLRVVDVLTNSEEATTQKISSTPCLVKEKPEPRVMLTGDLSAASVRWQLAVAERAAMESRTREQDLRQANLDSRERS